MGTYCEFMPVIFYIQVEILLLLPLPSPDIPRAQKYTARPLPQLPQSKPMVLLEDLFFMQATPTLEELKSDENKGCLQGNLQRTVCFKWSLQHEKLEYKIGVSLTQLLLVTSSIALLFYK